MKDKYIHARQEDGKKHRMAKGREGIDEVIARKVKIGR